MADQVSIDMTILYKAILENNWSSVKDFIDHHPMILNQEFVSSTGETPLHVAAKFGNLNMVEELVKLVSPDYLEKLDVHRYTPLGIAASHRGIIPIAKCLIAKNSKVLQIPNGELRLIPVTLAFRVGLSERGRYLYSVTPLQVFKLEENRFLGPSFLRGCFVGGDLDIALDLLQKCEELVFGIDFGYSIIEHMAFYLSGYLNKRQLWFWKQCIYHYIKIPSTTTSNHFRADMQQQGKLSNRTKGLNLLQWLISITYNLTGMKEIQKLKLQHTQATEILNIACNNLTFLSEDKKKMIAKSLLTAAKLGNAEFFLKVSTANPEFISMVTFSRQQKRHAFFNAVEFRQAEIFDLLRGFRFKNVVAAMFTENNDNLLHSAAKLAPASQLNRIPGAALQMQRECQWFKAVEKIVSPGIELRLNKEGLTPLDYFKENHKDLRSEGEKWMKDTASSCSVVSTLIVTIMFATAFTVPGGNDQTSGYPIFLKKKLFKAFLISDALSLFASATSVLTFLGILTSRYAEEDFLYSLPTKLIIGLSSLFLSIASMLIAFSATIIIMLEHDWSGLSAFLPVIIVATVPLILFVLLQFPLLVEMIYSTYGPGIFKKKVEKWP